MSPRMLKILYFLLPPAVIVGLGFAAYSLQVARWDGHQDLDVRFQITDAQTGRPIPKAVVHVRLETTEMTTRCALREEKGTEFTLPTDNNGTVVETCHQCATYGALGMWVDTFYVEIPAWWCHGTASGYEPSQPVYLIGKYSRQAQRGNPNAMLSITIPLRRNSN